MVPPRLCAQLSLPDSTEPDPSLVPLMVDLANEQARGAAEIDVRDRRSYQFQSQVPSELTPQGSNLENRDSPERRRRYLATPSTTSLSSTLSGEEEVIYPLNERALSALPPHLQLHMRKMQEERILRLQTQVPLIGMSDILSYPQPRDPSQRNFSSRYPGVKPAERSPSRPLLKHGHTTNSADHEESPFHSPIATRDESLSPTSPMNPYNLQPTSPLTWLASAPLGRPAYFAQSSQNISDNPPTESNGLWLHRNVPIGQGYTVWDRNGQFDAPTLRPGTPTPCVDITQFDFGFHKPEPPQTIESSQTPTKTDLSMANPSRGIDLINKWVHPALQADLIEKWKYDGLLPKGLPTVPGPAAEASVIPAPVDQTPVTPPRRPILTPYEPRFYPRYGQSLSDLNDDELEERRMCTQRPACQGALGGSPFTAVTTVTPITPPCRIRPHSPTGSMRDIPRTPSWRSIPCSEGESNGYLFPMDHSPTDNIVQGLPSTPPYQLSPSSQCAVRGSPIATPQRQLLPPFSPSRTSLNSNQLPSLHSMEVLLGHDEEASSAQAEWTPEMHASILGPVRRSRQERRNAFVPEQKSRRQTTRVPQSSPPGLLTIDTTGLPVLTGTEKSAHSGGQTQESASRPSRSRVREGLRRLSHGFRRK
ncbi:hypothetical protein N7499_010030 [Penicillium canescens]|nr:hypothetical protein N7499_010030 [Penicillium canescens]KAJ6170694.1 hypothetical protein N7485_008040 [Penicillium canescens]